MTETYYQIIPRNIAHMSSILSILILGRETKVAIRNTGFISIVVKEESSEILQFIKKELNTEIREVNHFPEFKENIFLSKPPKYFFNSFFPFILETAILSQVGDNCIIKTERFRSLLPFRKIRYGQKVHLSLYRMRIYLPFLAREYISRDEKQRLTMRHGYKIIVTQQEIRTFITTEGYDGLLAL